MHCEIVIMATTTKLIVRTSDVIKRKQRTISVIKPTIKINPNPKSKTICSFIFYTYNSNNHILVGMNEFGEIITILSTIDPKQNRTNINFKYVKDVDALITLIKTKKPKTLYMNDGDLFNSSDYVALKDTKIEYRSASLLHETIEMIRRDSTHNNNNENPKASMYKLPSFRTVKSLIPDLTYAEYALIYL